MEQELDVKIGEYNDYIEEHRKNVVKAYNELAGIDSPVVKEIFEDEDLSEEVYRRVMDHDSSKYSVEEFEAYRKNFFPIDDKEKEDNKKAFDKAWEHHWKNNDHHWQARENTKTLNKPACIENVLDWQAMGYKFGNMCYQYYDEHKEEMNINDLERKYMEDIMNAFRKKDEDAKVN